MCTAERRRDAAGKTINNAASLCDMPLRLLGNSFATGIESTLKGSAPWERYWGSVVIEAKCEMRVHDPRHLRY